MLGQAQGLHGRLGQVVDQDRRLAVLADRGQQLMRLGHERGEGRPLAHRRLRDRPPRAQGADQHRVVRPLGQQAQVVGEGRRHAQVDAARQGLGLQELRLHLDVAVAHQDQIQPPPLAAELGHPARAPHRPVVLAALARLQPKPLQHRLRIAAETGRQGLELRLRRLLGEDVALGEPLQGQHDGVRVQPDPGGQAGELVGQVPRLGEILHHRRRLGVERQLQLAQGMDRQNAAALQRDQVQETGLAQAQVREVRR